MSEESFEWRTESETPAPTRLELVDDSLNADDALRRVRKGEFLLYRGDFHNARQLLGAMSRRLPTPTPKGTPLESFRAERISRAREHETVGRLVVELGPGYALRLKRAPDVSKACREAWGSSTAPRTVVALKTLQGVISAAEWRKKGLEVPGLTETLIPHYGVYVPTRTDYVELLGKLTDVKGKKCFDIGTGTGVLSFVLLQKGATSVVGTDLDSRAIACAAENIERFGVRSRFRVEQRELFPAGRADLVVCNPPWIPEPPKNRVDRAVFDEDSAMLKSFLAELPDHLTPGGRGVLLISNLAECLGLRDADFLKNAFANAGLRVVKHLEMAAKHGKARDTTDPLHAARSKEVTSMWVLSPGK